MIAGQITALPAEAFETPAPTSAYASAFASLYGAFS
jgi:hypothetical protein